MRKNVPVYIRQNFYHGDTEARRNPGAGLPWENGAEQNIHRGGAENRNVRSRWKNEALKQAVRRAAGPSFTSAAEADSLPSFHRRPEGVLHPLSLLQSWLGPPRDCHQTGAGCYARKRFNLHSPPVNSPDRNRLKAQAGAAVLRSTRSDKQSPEY